MAAVGQTQFFEFFEAFDEHIARFSRPSKANQEIMRNEKKRIRRLDSLARLVIKEKTGNCAAVAFCNDALWFTANDYPEIKGNITQILAALSLVKMDGDTVVNTDAADKALLNYISSAKKPKKTGASNKSTKNLTTYDRLVRDVKKFLASLKTNKVFTSSEIQKLLSQSYMYLENPKKIHAEIRLATCLVESNPSKKHRVIIPIGVSKLCCRLCMNSIGTINNCNEKIHFRVRGWHGNFYYGWTPTSLLLSKSHLMNFLGKKAFEKYTESNSGIKKRIWNALNNLESERKVLEGDYLPIQKRGGVQLKSTSMPDDSASTESSLSSRHFPSSESPSTDDSSSDSESAPDSSSDLSQSSDS